MAEMRAAAVLQEQAEQLKEVTSDSETPSTITIMDELMSRMTTGYAATESKESAPQDSGEGLIQGFLRKTGGLGQPEGQQRTWSQWVMGESEVSQPKAAAKRRASLSQGAMGSAKGMATAKRRASLTEIQSMMSNSSVRAHHKNIVNHLSRTSKSESPECERASSPEAGRSSPSPQDDSSPSSTRMRSDSTDSNSSAGSSPRTRGRSRASSRSSAAMGKAERLAAEKSLAEGYNQAWIDDFFKDNKSEVPGGSFTPYVPYTKARFRAETI